MSIRKVLLCLLFNLLFVLGILSQPKNDFFFEKNTAFSRSFFDKELDSFFSNNNPISLQYQNNLPRSFYKSSTFTFGYNRLFNNFSIGLWLRKISKGQKSKLNFIYTPNSVTEAYGGYIFIIQQESYELGISTFFENNKLKFAILGISIGPQIEVPYKQTATTLILNKNNGEFVRGSNEIFFFNPNKNSKIKDAIANLKNGRFRLGVNLKIRVRFTTIWQGVSPFVQIESAFSSRLINLEPNRKSFLPDGNIISNLFSYGILFNF